MAWAWGRVSQLSGTLASSPGGRPHSTQQQLGGALDLSSVSRGCRAWGLPGVGGGVLPARRLLSVRALFQAKSSGSFLLHAVHARLLPSLFFRLRLMSKLRQQTYQLSVRLSMPFWKRMTCISVFPLLSCTLGLR